MAPAALRFDKIGYWSQLKLEIVREYAKTYSTILANQRNFQHLYIDAFAGAGVHQLKTTGAMVAGSPLNALAVDPPFHELHLVDMDGAKVANLQQLVGDRKDVHIYQGNCNKVLIEEIFPKVRFNEFKRALCLLDPYGLTLNWEVIAKAGEMKTIEIFLNFPIMDMNRNALWSNPARAAPDDLERMTSFWGDDSWKKAVYKEQGSLFGESELVKDGGNQQIVDAFRKRLREVAGFREVPKPIPMRNSKNAIVYYLFFASPNATGAKIAKAIFKKFENHEPAGAG